MVLTSRSLSVVQATVGTPACNPHTTVPATWSGVARRRQGPGDWIRPGQTCTSRPRVIASNSRLIAALSRATVYVADGGQSGAAVAQVTVAPNASAGEAGRQAPGGNIALSRINSWSLGPAVALGSVVASGVVLIGVSGGASIHHAAAAAASSAAAPAAIAAIGALGRRRGAATTQLASMEADHDSAAGGDTSPAGGPNGSRRARTTSCGRDAGETSGDDESAWAIASSVTTEIGSVGGSSSAMRRGGIYASGAAGTDGSGDVTRLPSLKTAAHQASNPAIACLPPGGALRLQHFQQITQPRQTLSSRRAIARRGAVISGTRNARAPARTVRITF